MTEPRTLEDRLTEMFNSSVRVEKMWPFPVSPANDDLADMFSLYDTNLPEEIKVLFERWTDEEQENLFEGGYKFVEAFDELCSAAFNRRTFGYIGIVATPVFDWNKDNTSASFSWGHYHTKVLFAPSADAFLDAAIAWADAQCEGDKIK